MILFFDTEFTERSVEGTLISMGIVSEQGDEFYAEFTDYNERQVAQVQKTWNIQKNIIDKLYMTPEKETFSKDNTRVLGDRERVANELATWLMQFDTIEFVCDRSAYSFVFLMQLFGGQDYIPKNMCPVLTIMNTLLARELRVSDWEASNMDRDELAKIDPAEFMKHKGNSLFDAHTVKQIAENYGLFTESSNESYIDNDLDYVEESLDFGSDWGI